MIRMIALMGCASMMCGVAHAKATLAKTGQRSAGKPAALTIDSRAPRQAGCWDMLGGGLTDYEGAPRDWAKERREIDQTISEQELPAQECFTPGSATKESFRSRIISHVNLADCPWRNVTQANGRISAEAECTTDQYRGMTLMLDGIFAARETVYTITRTYRDAQGKPATMVWWGADKWFGPKRRPVEQPPAEPPFVAKAENAPFRRLAGHWDIVSQLDRYDASGLSGDLGQMAAGMKSGVGRKDEGSTCYLPSKVERDDLQQRLFEVMQFGPEWKIVTSQFDKGKVRVELVSDEAGQGKGRMVISGTILPDLTSLTVTTNATEPFGVKGAVVSSQSHMIAKRTAECSTDEPADF